MADPSLARKIRPSSLESYLTYGYVPGHECILEGVRKLPPGHALVCSLDTLAIRVWPYWRLPEPQAGKDTLEDCARELKKMLCDSVRRQLIADVPIGVLLSGGVDSSLVTAAAAEVSSNPIHTFTVRFPDHHAFDEGKYAEIVAKHFGTRHTELVAEPASLELLPVLAAQYDEPMCDSSMIPTYLVSRMIRKSATVALGGDGGDELFGGYRSYNLYFQQRRLASMLPSPMRRLLASVATRMMPVGTPGRNYISSIAGSPAERVARASRHHDRVSRRRLVPVLNELIPYRAPTPEAFKETLFQAERGLPGAAMAVDFGTYLPEDILVKVDRASMLASLETRAPFLDYRIIEFAFTRIPNEWRANAVDRKIVLRKLCASMLPASLDINRKQGFSLPLGDWFRGAWGTYAREVLLDSSACLFDHDRVRDLLNGLMRGRTNSERIFGLLLFELWRRKYNAVLS
jgi:asparagine synthase (glutamine-hydrolysing)